MPPTDRPATEVNVGVPPKTPRPGLIRIGDAFTAGDARDVPGPAHTYSTVTVEFRPPPDASNDRVPVNDTDTVTVGKQLRTKDLPCDI